MREIRDSSETHSRIEGMVQRGHFVQHTTECPDIALVIVGLILADLWRQIVRGADHGLCHQTVFAQNSCHTKITYPIRE
jgi:hypothetical protein